MQKIPTIFFGSSRYALPILQVLFEHFELKLIVTTEQNTTDIVPQFALTHDIPLVQTTTLANDEIESKLRDIDVEVAVLASFRLIVPEEIITIFPKGIVNIHPSFLPEYRGVTPIQQAILDGKTETAVSLMVIDTELDHGPLLAQIPLEINDNDTAESLYRKAFKIGAEKLVDILPAYVVGNIEPREQNHTKATFTSRDLTREAGFVDLSQTKNMSLLEIKNWKLKIERMIRAYYPWPGVWTKVVINNNEKILKLLPNDMLQVEGKKPVNKKDLLNGYPELKDVIEKIS